MKKNIYLLIAGIINALTAFLHTFAGHIDHLTPVIESNFNPMDKTIIIGVWHMVSIFFFMTCYPIFKLGFKPLSKNLRQLVQFIGISYILFGFFFIFLSIYMDLFAAQWVLLLPIGILCLLGLKKLNKS